MNEVKAELHAATGLVRVGDRLINLRKVAEIQLNNEARNFRKRLEDGTHPTESCVQVYYDFALGDEYAFANIYGAEADAIRRFFGDSEPAKTTPEPDAIEELVDASRRVVEQWNTVEYLDRIDSPMRSRLGDFGSLLTYMDTVVRQLRDTIAKIEGAQR